MVQKYKKVTNGKSRCVFDKHIMEKAVQSIKEGMSYGAAAKRYGISKTVLYRRVNLPETRSGVGRPPALSNRMEELIAEKIIVFSSFFKKIIRSSALPQILLFEKSAIFHKKKLNVAQYKQKLCSILKIRPKTK